MTSRGNIILVSFWFPRKTKTASSSMTRTLVSSRPVPSCSRADMLYFEVERQHSPMVGTTDLQNDPVPASEISDAIGSSCRATCRCRKRSAPPSTDYARYWPRFRRSPREHGSARRRPCLRSCPWRLRRLRRRESRQPSSGVAPARSSFRPDARRPAGGRPNPPVRSPAAPSAFLVIEVSNMKGPATSTTTIEACSGRRSWRSLRPQQQGTAPPSPGRARRLHIGCARPKWCSAAKVWRR